MKCNRLMRTLLSMIIAVGLLAGCGGSKEASASEDAEIQKAIELGFVSDDLHGGYDKQIKYAEFCSILDAMIEEVRPECLEAWKKSSAAYRDADDLMTRFEGMAVLFYAAESAGLDAVGIDEAVPLEEYMPDGMDFWEGITWDYPLLPNIEQTYYNEEVASGDYAWRCEYPYLNNAGWFAQQSSYGNGKTYFDYNENYMLCFGDALTRGDAIRSVERLYETAILATYTAAEQIKCSVTEEMIALANKMPAVAYNALPDWKGHNIERRFEVNRFGLGRNYMREEIDALAASGFDFIRVPLTFDQFFEGKSTSCACAAAFASLDQLISWCAQYGIHVCIDLHDMPGFTTNGDDRDDILFWDAESQKLFVEFWSFMADHYTSVPSNLLSFNLLNEPHGTNEKQLTDEVYSAVMKKVIHAVREVSPDRLMIASTLGVIWGEPVQGLAKEKVAQGFSGYLLADETEQWPFYYINQCFHAAEGDIVLKGDFNAGTEVILMPHSYADGTYVVKADGTQIGKFTVDGNAAGENGCKMVAGKGTVEWNWKGYYRCTMTLPQNCREIRISETENGYGEFVGIKVKNDAFMVTLNGDVNHVGHPTPAVLTIGADGMVTAKELESLRRADRAMIHELLQPCLAFGEKYDVDFMILECGTQFTIPGDVACAFTEDYLTAMDVYGIPWACWADHYSPLIHKQIPERRLMFNGEQWLREGHTYDNITENYIVDTELMEVYKNHMN